MTTQTDLSNQDLLIFETRKKSASSAYLLWFFLGGFGAHWFFLGNKKRAWLTILFGILTLGIRVLVDAFVLHKKVEEYNTKLLEELIQSKAQS